GRPGISIPEQARAQVEQQGEALRAALERALRTIQLNPLLENLKAGFQQALAGLGEATATQGQIAFDRAEASMRDRVTKIGDEIAAMSDRIGAAGLTPLDADLAKIHQHFEEMRRALEALQTRLSELS